MVLGCRAALGGGDTSSRCQAEEVTHFAALHWPQPVRELHDPLQPLHELLREREEPTLLTRNCQQRSLKVPELHSNHKLWRCSFAWLTMTKITQIYSCTDFVFFQPSVCSLLLKHWCCVVACKCLKVFQGGISTYSRLTVAPGEVPVPFVTSQIND